MKKTEYQKPIVNVVKTTSAPLVAGTTRSVPFNPKQGTSDALSRGFGSHEWDEDE